MLPFILCKLINYIQGLPMLGAGIHHTHILVVDRFIEPVSGKVVICALNGELTVKRLERGNNQWKLKNFAEYHFQFFDEAASQKVRNAYETVKVLSKSG